QLLILGVLVVVVAIIVECLLVLLANRASAALRRSRRLSLWLDRLLGSILVGLGIRLGLSERGWRGGNASGVEGLKRVRRHSTAHRQSGAVMSLYSKHTPANLIPCLRYRDVPSALEWLCRAFDFQRQRVFED